MQTLSQQQKTQIHSLYNPQEEHDACGVGFIGNISNKAEHRIIEYALCAMSRLTHRGGQEEDKKMSDGSGMLVPISKDFFGKIFPAILETDTHWGIGSFFLPYDSFLHDALLESVERVAKRLSFKIAMSREVPTDINIVSRKVLATLPEFRQILFISEDPTINADTIEKQLYILRKQMEFEAIKVLNKYKTDLSAFHIASLSSKSIVYKGILPGKNLGKFYLDLSNPSFEVPFAVFHERFSTNTKPSWHMTQPFRNIAHNGEINTIRGNTTHMAIREAALSSEVLGENLHDVLPCIHASTSDSGSFDNVFELLLQGGYDLSHATATMIPEPTFDSSGSTTNSANPEYSELSNAKKNAFYTYHTPLMEPWDGPTTMVFTDGYSKVGASLDRNGLRPCRYSITKDNIIILSSEVAVLDLEQCEYVEQGQLAPRAMLIVDFENNRLIHDKEIKEKLFNKAPYEEILQKTRIDLTQNTAQEMEIEEENAAFFDLFGFGEKSPEALMMAMINTKEEPVGAMGLDEPLAVLSHKAQPLFNYFKQLFAQVTNPSIDPIREKFSMSLATNLGGKSNLFQKPEEQAPYFTSQTPFLFASTLSKIRANTQVKSQTLSITMPLHAGFDGFNTTLTALCLAAEKAVTDGTRVLILSDKDLTKDKMPLPVLLAVTAVNQALIRKNLRHACDIIIETGQAFEVMHMALLLSFGANGIYPYAAFAAIGNYLQNKRSKEGYSFGEGIKRYCLALEKGLLKVFARLGISTLTSFIGSRSFECIGLHKDVIDKFFTNTLSRIGGISLEDIYQENYDRFLSFVINTHESSKTDKHIWTKEITSTLRKSVVENDYNFFSMYTKQLHKQEEITLRSVWKFKPTTAIDIDEVESVESILKRFYSAAMSLGAISKESHECIALAFNHLGLSSNCGEGGEEVSRSQSRGSDKDLCSRIRQIASGRFGVTAEYLAAGDEVQIKIAQGAKPGEGGQLPGHKVTPYIAQVRHTKEKVSLISPPPHHDIYSIEDLAQLIYDIKKLKKGIKVSVKLVAQAGIGTVAVGVVKAGADSICISGHDGGTGAAPLSSIYHVGLPWELGVAEVHQALIANSMRYKVTLQTDGQIQSGRDIVTAFMLGADEVSFGTSLLVSMGCVLCRQCYKGLCPVGICTQDPALIAKFIGKATHIKNYLTFLAREIREYLAMLGVASVDELIGRADLFQVNCNSLADKAKNIDMSALFQCLPYTKREKKGNRPIEMAEWDEALLERTNLALKEGKGFVHTQKVKNTDRTIGANVAGAMALSYKEFEDNFITLNCLGGAGQSFAAFAPKGLSLNLEGNANDYVAKGLCGGIVSIRPDSNATKTFESQSLIGNVALYGATAGKLFVSGKAGERFAVRNSGAITVVEGVGEHGCEYMTGGTVAILGDCGYNFAAGMTGGVIYLYTTKESLASKINPTNAAIFNLDEEDTKTLHNLLTEHVNMTESIKASTILKNYDAEVKNFVKVMYSE